MDVTPLIRQGAQIIQSYAGGVFKISGHVYKTPVIVTPEETIVWDAPGKFEDLTAEHFLSLTRLRFAQTPSPLREREGEEFPDIILLGTGKTMRLISPELRKALQEKGLRPDPMDTGAACRTYNVLMAEGRRVAAF